MVLFLFLFVNFDYEKCVCEIVVEEMFGVLILFSYEVLFCVFEYDCISIIVVNVYVVLCVMFYFEWLVGWFKDVGYVR